MLFKNNLWIKESLLLVVLGHFNVWADAENNPSALKVSTIMTLFELTQLVNGSTHTASHPLDHVYANLLDADLTSAFNLVHLMNFLT